MKFRASFPLVLLIAAFGFQSNVRAATGVDVGDAAAAPGRTAVVAIALEATEFPVAGLQFDIAFDPTQLTSQPALVGGAQGADVAVRSRETQVGRRRVLVYSTTAGTLTEGELVRIPFTIDAQAPEGTLDLTLIESQAILAKSDATRVGDPTLSNGQITVNANAGGAVRIAGTVTYFGGQQAAVRNLRLRVSGDLVAEHDGDDAGAFAFDVDSGANVNVIPFRAGNVEGDDIAADGVTVADIIAIRRHILADQRLGSGYAVLAADPNRSNGVDVSDILVMRDVILGHRNFFTGTAETPDPVFRFLPTNIQFGDILIPWADLGQDGANAFRRFAALNADQFAQDFVGIKLGDADGSWTEVAQQGAGLALSESNEEEDPFCVLRLGSTFAQSGEQVEIPVILSVEEPTVGLQFTLTWDVDSLDFVGLKEMALPGFNAASHLNGELLDEGALALAWDDAGLNGVSGGVIFKLVFDVSGAEGDAGSAIQLTSKPTQLAASGLNGSQNLTADAGYVALHSAQTSDGHASFLPYPVVLDDETAFRIWYPTEAGQTYVLERATALGAGEWDEVSRFIGSGRLEALEDTEIGAQNQFYRVRALGFEAQ